MLFYNKLPTNVTDLTDGKFKAFLNQSLYYTSTTFRYGRICNNHNIVKNIVKK